MKHLVLLVIFYACIAMQVQGIVAAESAVMMETVTETQPQKQQKRPAAKKKAASTATSTTATAIKQTKKVPSEFPYMDKGFLLSSQEFDFYNVNKGSAQTRTIKIKNNTGSAKDIFFAPLFDFISYEANPRRLAAGAVGEISVTFDSEKCPLWEKFSADFYLITSFNSTNKNSPKLTVVAEVVEDFTNLTAEQKKNAP
ncbi:MAG: hypothetical protein LBV31_01960 [Prevotellaceae bacterium]|jgi:hypothetical protein|nr:hypothetical protein [Prevotellaceae bacterium]